MSENAEARAAMQAANSSFTAETTESLLEGIAHLERAAALGDAEALTQLAHFVVAGVTNPADWDRGADMLLEAAQRGSTRAADELHLVAGGAGGELPSVRRRIDMRSAVAPRRMENLSTAPRIRVVRGFLSAGECRWLIESGRHRLKPAMVYDKFADNTVRVGARTNSSTSFRILDIDLPLVLIHARMSNTIGLPGHWFEPAALLHYTPGQQFLPHYDFLDPNVPAYAADIARMGQRIATLLIYLNDDFEGGETAFPSIDLRFKGRTGDLLAFANLKPDGAPDELTLHAGLPPVRGEKWLLSQWVRDRPRSV
jgi:prolyl 4-hydroxylase